MQENHGLVFRSQEFQQPMPSQRSVAWSGVAWRGVAQRSAVQRSAAQHSAEEERRGDIWYDINFMFPQK